MALTAAPAADLVRAARVDGRPLTVFQNRRWDSDQLTLRRLLAAGELGARAAVRVAVRALAAAVPGGAGARPAGRARAAGCCWTSGSHLVDQALHAVRPGRAGVRRGGRAAWRWADDDVFVALEHVSGVRSHLWAGALAAAPGPRLRVLGTGGAYVVDALDGQEDRLRETGALPPGGLLEPRDRWGRLVRGEEVSAVEPEPGGWQTFYPAVLAAVRDGGPVPVDPREAVAAIEVLDAARRSAATRSVVTLTGGGGRP